jgi:hypothetical protein
MSEDPSPGRHSRAGTRPATAKAAFPAAQSSTAAARRSMTLAVAISCVEPSAHTRFKGASRSCTLETNSHPRIKSGVQDDPPFWTGLGPALAALARPKGGVRCSKPHLASWFRGALVLIASLNSPVSDSGCMLVSLARGLLFLIRQRPSLSELNISRNAMRAGSNHRSAIRCCHLRYSTDFTAGNITRCCG